MMDVMLTCPRHLYQVWRDGATQATLACSAIDAVPLSRYRLFPSLSPSASAVPLCWTVHILESKIVVHPSLPSDPTETSCSDACGAYNALLRVRHRSFRHCNLIFPMPVVAIAEPLMPWMFLGSIGSNSEKSPRLGDM